MYIDKHLMARIKYRFHCTDMYKNSIGEKLFAKLIELGIGFDDNVEKKLFLVSEMFVDIYPIKDVRNKDVGYHYKFYIGNGRKLILEHTINSNTYE